MRQFTLLLLSSVILLTGCEAFFIGVEEDFDAPPTIMPPEEKTMPETTAPEEAEMINPDADANVEFVRAVNNGDTWTFHVTVRHPDTGWDDYADGWDVVLPDGTVLKSSPEDTFTRLLLHPHETEQPFTRSQSGLTIPDGVTQVTVRAHDLVDGFGGVEVSVDLTQAEGEFFTVEGG